MGFVLRSFSVAAVGEKSKNPMWKISDFLVIAVRRQSMTKHNHWRYEVIAIAVLSLDSV